MKKSLKDINVAGKKVLMRVDFNVPMQNGKITNDNRIVAALPSIKYVLDNGGKLIAFSHLGKVKTPEDLQSKSLKPAAERLAELLGKPVKFVPCTRGKELEDAVAALKDGEVLMFENTRFEDLEGKKESKNDPELGKYWASLGDIFVNDAFGTAHRAHASNVGISANIGAGNAVAGFLVEKELKFLGEALDNPKHPFVAILGGAKVSDKIAVIENLLGKADKVIIGGAMAYTFQKSQGKEIGTSLVEDDRLDVARATLAKAGSKLVLPVDVVVADKFDNNANYKTVSTNAMPADMMGMDIGAETVALFSKEIQNAKTVVWNGPMGVFEMENFAKGTIGVCEAIAGLKDAITIIGGGDSASAATNLGYADKFTHISTGGGASLEYLEGKELPGVACLSDK